MSVIT